MKEKIVQAPIHTPFIRLDALLKLTGFVQTGGAAKEFITQGAVKLKGETVTQRGKKIYPGDRVAIDDYWIEVTSVEA